MQRKAAALFFLLAMYLHYSSTSALPKLAGVLLIPLALLILPRRQDAPRALSLLTSSSIWYAELAMLTAVSCVIWLATLKEPAFMAPGVIKLLQQLVNITVSVSAVYLIGERTAELAFWGILAYHFQRLLAALAAHGVTAFLTDLLQTAAQRQQAGALTAMELNAVTYAMGFFALYFTLYQGGLTRRRRFLYASLAYFFFFLGFKRIGLAAMAVALTGALLLRLLPGRVKPLVCYALEALTMLTCVIYIPMIRSGAVVSLLTRLGINPMSRDGLYQFVRDCYEFKVDFLGRGMGYITEYLNRARELQLRYPGAGAHYIHNDVLLFYIEQGFGGFLLWLGFRCFAQQRWWLKKDTGIGVMYCVMNLYLFMTYATDNTSLDYQITLTGRLLLLTMLVRTGRPPEGRNAS